MPVVRYSSSKIFFLQLSPAPKMEITSLTLEIKKRNLNLPFLCDAGFDWPVFAGMFLVLLQKRFECEDFSRLQRAGGSN